VLLAFFVPIINRRRNITRLEYNTDIRSPLCCNNDTISTMTSTNQPHAQLR
jgi:hypothetical protein